MYEHNMWQFNESSLPLLQKCIDAAKKQNNTENNWLKQFGVKEKELIKKEVQEDTVIDQKMDENEEVILLSSGSLEMVEDTEASLKIDADHKMDVDNELVETEVDMEFISELKVIDVENFNEIEETCMKNERYYEELAKNLHVKRIKQLYEHVFDSNNIKSEFYEKFCILFMPALLKRDERLGFDLLDRARKKEGTFEKLLNIIINDVGISKNVLQLFVSSFNYVQKMDLFDNFLRNSSNQVFIHHLHTIHTIYKEIKKTEVLQTRLQSKFTDLSPFCQNDKGFGKFLLDFLQVQKQFRSNCEELQQIVDTHTSMFAEACGEALDEIKEMQLNQSSY